MVEIRQKIEDVNKTIQDAANKKGHDPSNINLIAVTKTVDMHKIEKAIECGVTDIGENKVQELLEKYDHLKDKVKWHMIGHLQKNKVKYIVDKVDLIHSLDSYELALEINKRAKKIDRKVSCLLQVNVSNETTKFGVKSHEAVDLMYVLDKLTHVKIKGLMTMAPYVKDKEDTRKYFKSLKELSKEISKHKLQNIEMEYLSMGMSNDFDIAIEEGANLVRVGSAIFGKR
ncbi:YggS family pyridoxal phosphate-dependent enzyme [Serpentinicella sp. ANB-PHB4]|uniref:YggS family pyridoxal phosphate-dependent enzyme n=1 Tax=Serpentinicella sp. ANB-PHB4 TaxID=3074076 RepID=UPI002862036E|nr:YggS family pyridoxal phosphate-dependent enzyme [Serpentinicella sp. ANB-PHB4]MDR5657921.1 YggS family pyridoxal phosphate-dependent enzyme [Serpentinicella sp. ANB-PHB4]